MSANRGEPAASVALPRADIGRIEMPHCGNPDLMIANRYAAL
jgi:hypothetical protein